MKTSGGGRPAGPSQRLIAAFALAAALGGCVTASGPSPSTLATAGGPPKGMARIVVVRPGQSTIVLRYASFSIKLDEAPLGDLAVGTSAFLDCQGGTHQLAAFVWGDPGTTRRDFTAVPGRTYYFRASLNAKNNDIAAVAAISPLGGVIAAAAAYDDRQGPIDLMPMSEAEAKQTIAAAQAAGQ